MPPVAWKSLQVASTEGTDERHKGEDAIDDLVGQLVEVAYAQHLRGGAGRRGGGHSCERPILRRRRARSLFGLPTR